MFNDVNQGIVVAATPYANHIFVNGQSLVMAAMNNDYLDCNLGNLFASHTVTATNGVAFPLNATPPALTNNGAHLFSDGTNLCIVIQNAVGTRSTNRITMTAYP